MSEQTLRLDMTLGRVVGGHAAAFPEKVALSDQGREITFARLYENARRLASCLRERGVDRGDRIAVWMPNSVEWVTVEIAASIAGVGIVAINSRYKSDEVGYMLAHSGAKLLFTAPRHRDTDFIALLDEIAGRIAGGAGQTTFERLPALQGVILCAEPAPSDRFETFEACLSKAGAPVAPGTDSEAILNIIYTSGTTSLPKGVLLSERALLPHSSAVADWFGVGATDVVLLLTPFCGIYGLDALLMTLAVGATAIIVPEFDPEGSLDLIAAKKVTFVGGTVDAVIRKWTEVQQAKPRDIASIRGSTIPVGWMQGKPETEMPFFEQALGVGFAHVYGLSETNSMVIVGDPDDPPARRHPVAGKTIWPGTEARIADPETDTDKPHGEVGEIRLRGPVLFSGYLNNPEATRAAFDAEGWFKTGDLGIAHADGRLAYTGRLKDIVKVSGFTVAPAEIETFLGQHPDVEAVQVVGFVSDGKEALGAAVRKRAGSALTEAGMQEFCRGRIATFKIPAQVVFVESFPVKSSANSDKIDRPALRSLFEAS